MKSSRLILDGSYSGISRMRGIYRYKAGDNEICKVDVSSFVPYIGTGGGKSFNSKFRLLVEINLPIYRSVNKNVDSVEQRIKLGRRTIRALATYSLQIP